MSTPAARAATGATLARIAAINEIENAASAPAPGPARQVAASVSRRTRSSTGGMMSVWGVIISCAIFVICGVTLYFVLWMREPNPRQYASEYQVPCDRVPSACRQTYGSNYKSDARIKYQVANGGWTKFCPVDGSNRVMENSSECKPYMLWHTFV